MLYENAAEDSPGHVGRCGIADESIEFLYPHYSFDHSARDHRRSPEPPGILAEIAGPRNSGTPRGGEISSSERFRGINKLIPNLHPLFVLGQTDDLEHS